MLYFIFLRNPKAPTDSRDDPFWEFGSFGRTGCHKRNLLHIKNSPINDGDVVAFLQGGNGSIRVVLVTPPLRKPRTLTNKNGCEVLELKWNKSAQPFPYEDAPLLIDNTGKSDFSIFRKSLKQGGRSSLIGATASQFRSRTRSLHPDIEDEIVDVFAKWQGERSERYTQVIDQTSRWQSHAMRAKWEQTRKERYVDWDMASTAGHNGNKSAGDNCARRKSPKPSRRGC